MSPSTPGLTAPQGGIVDFDFFNSDPVGAAWNTATTATPRFNSGMALAKRTSVTADEFKGTGVVDATAPAGGLKAVFTAVGPASKEVTHIVDPADPNAITVTARTPTAVTLGTAISGQSFGAAKASNLYKLTTTADDQVLVMVFDTLGTSLTGTTALSGAVAPATGRFAEGQLFDTSYNSTGAARLGLALAPKKGDFFISTFGSSFGGGTTGYGYGMTVKSVAATKFSLKEPSTPDTATSPIVIDLLLDGAKFATDGSIDASSSDIDYMTFKASKTGRVYMQAVRPIGLTGTSTVYLDVYASNCSTTVSFASTTGKNEFASTADTTYCLRVSSGSNFGPYQLILYIE